MLDQSVSPKFLEVNLEFLAGPESPDDTLCQTKCNDKLKIALDMVKVGQSSPQLFLHSFFRPTHLLVRLVSRQLWIGEIWFCFVVMMQRTINVCVIVAMKSNSTCETMSVKPDSMRSLSYMVMNQSPVLDGRKSFLLFPSSTLLEKILWGKALWTLSRA
jgi:hypothetical protein